MRTEGGVYKVPVRVTSDLGHVATSHTLVAVDAALVDISQTSTGENVDIYVDSGNLVVIQGATQLATAALVDIDGLVVYGSPLNETFVVHIAGLTIPDLLDTGIWIVAGETTDNVDDDTLQLFDAGPPFTLIDNYDYTTGGPEDGTIKIDSLDVQFFEFEPIVDNLRVNNRKFSIGTSGDQTIRLQDNDDPNDGISVLDDGGLGLFEKLIFTNPLVSFKAVGGDENDHFLIKKVDNQWEAETSAEGGEGDDVMDASESETPVTLLGEQGQDSLIGGNAGDVLDGGEGDDDLAGGNGDDVLVGGDGVDNVDGGQGADTVITDFSETVRSAEGSVIEIAATFINPAAVEIDWGDGSIAAADEKYVQADGTVGGWHMYPEDGPYDVTVTVTYTDSSVSTHTPTIQVTNVAPTVSIGDDVSVIESSTVAFSGSFTDPGSLDSRTVAWDFGDATTTEGTLAPSHTYVDDGVYTVTLTVNDDDDGIGTSTLTVTVTNAIPTVEAGADAHVGEGEVVNFSGSFADLGTADTHAILWDFGDGTTDASNTLTPSHSYTVPGTYTVTLTVTDDDGGVGSDTLAVDIGLPGADVFGGVLIVRGTDESDHVLIGKIGCGKLIVIADFLPGFWHAKKFDAAGIDRVKVILGDGNDHVAVASNFDIPAMLDGGSGDDFLKGGSGDDILLGGDGKDLLVGARGRDLLIGGRGRDRIVGNRDDDILISGYTAFDANDTALLAIMEEWTSSRTYAARVENLKGTGSSGMNQTYFFKAEGDDRTVFDDDARDVLTGGQGLDWFLANCEHDDEGRRDRITDLKASEFTEDLDWIEAEVTVEDPEI